MTYYIHDVPGRLRIRSPHVKNNEDTAYRLENLLRQMAGVNNIDINLMTGSCLVKYDPATASCNDIVSMLTEEGYFDPSRAITNDQYINDGVSKVITFLSAFL
jgi:copper chaperone CopZ